MSSTVDVQEPILRRHLQDLKHEDGIWSGYLKSEEEVKQLERSLAAANLKFAVRSSRRKAGKVVFSTVNGGVPIHLDLVPFRVLGDATKQCIFGEEYYKKSDAQHKKDTTADWQAIKKKRLQLQGTKKKGCRAVMNFKYIELYPKSKFLHASIIKCGYTFIKL
ncbi:uncharacterized protein LOC119375575 isoform X2 [Rhipicephalus sanguineus]|uniref:uncharacterized protein LOC119375575 isoform X2 n=1 Tax=Rhipicephalus sanguineus TaxID=34632 RepID=UPI00189539F4|nr:uncharacterized protein LOC119375575 isoform X2 [Rhipicephalus sanguineus]